MSPPDIIIPKALRPGGTVGFISPSERLHEAMPDPTARGKALFEASGYKVKIFWTHEDPGTRTVNSHIAVRKAELLAAFADPQVDALVCMIGGSTMCELVPAFLRDEAALDVLRRNPKVVVGMSDITFLHWLLRATTGLRTFYGPTVVPELGEYPSAMAFSTENLFRAISHPAGTTPIGAVPRSSEWRPKLPDFFYGDQASTVPSAYEPTPAWRWLRGGKAEGRIFGGCLSVVVRLSGVPALVPDWSGRVIFLETQSSEASLEQGFLLEKIRQALADIIARGWFDKVAGLVLGRFFGYNTEEQRAEVDRVVRETVIENEWIKNEVYGDFPVLTNVDIGHTSPMITLPMDALVRLDSEKDEFSILEAGVC
ncbi:hypothetical protein VP1G_07619 [Cytospora mali]|uniref:Carboxypeptidase n=1 Tax=Cytospora mali TaxID=578113 RepID=A0A194V8V2_CYTMA|nr:hypothetical protein VP1G_07619 [Valsa mali var. pyri (nom. inval.)]